jgi:two-component system sensor histidine kinase TctE
MQVRVRHMLHAVERLADMTQKLLVLARAEALSAHSAFMESVNLGELVPDVAREWASHAMEKHIELSFENFTHESKVHGNARLLHELFANLIDNAIRYTPEGGSVAILISHEEALHVDIEDSGIGIAPEERDKVFDRFYRVLGTHTDGSGLGLSIVREIAALHRVDIALHDSSLGGIRVRVTFHNDAPA